MPTDSPPLPWIAGSGGLRLSVRLTPRGGRDRIEGIANWDGRTVLKVRVAAAPVEGEANRALCKLIAKSAGIAPREVHLESGETSRLKTLRLAGDPAGLAERLGKAVTNTG